MAFTTNCQFCLKKFKKGTSLCKHLEVKHSQRTQETVVFKDEDDQPVQALKPAVIRGDGQIQQYLSWLSVLTERINATLIPDFPAKWCSIYCFQVPSCYFAHVLHRLNNPWLDSVRETKHRRQLIFKKKSRRLSYKIYEEELLKELLDEQDVLSFKRTALYCNNEEVRDIFADMGVEDALALAKERASNPAITRPTSKSLIEINTSRQAEFIWWPCLYSNPQYGKLTIRFYVHKCVL